MKMMADKPYVFRGDQLFQYSFESIVAVMPSDEELNRKKIVYRKMTAKDCEYNEGPLEALCSVGPLWHVADH